MTHIGVMNGNGATQLALVFGGFLGQDVTFEGLPALDGATRTNAETLFSAAFGFHFWHGIAVCSTSLIVLVRRCKNYFCKLVGPEPLVAAMPGFFK